MEYIEFSGKILEGKYLSLPSGIIEKIKDPEQVMVILRLDQDTVQDESYREKVRMKSAFDEYKAKYPDDKVTLEDFRYVGILSEGVRGEYKDDVIDAIEAKYNDL